MAAGKPKIYWDTAPLLAWITNEKRQDPAEMAGLSEVVEMVDRGQVILMTSVLWRAEIFEVDLTPAQRRRLMEAFDGVGVVELQIDSRVMDLAGQIRAMQAKSGRKDVIKAISAPDAIHLASAIHYEAAEFHTFDGKRQGKNNGGLLTLDGNVAGHRLKICSPRGQQLRIEDAIGPSEVGDTSEL